LWEIKGGTHSEYEYKAHSLFPFITLTLLFCKSIQQTYILSQNLILPLSPCIVKVKLGKPADSLVFLGLILQNPSFRPRNEALFKLRIVEELMKRCTKRYVQSFGDRQN